MRLNSSNEVGDIQIRFAVEKIIAAHRTGQPRSIRVSGRSFLVSPEVFDPTIAPSGEVGMSFVGMPWFEGKAVAEIGAGSGVFSCLMALNGATKVVSTDISKSALLNIKTNSSRYGLEGIIDIREGRGLQPIRQEDNIHIFYCDLPFADWRKPIDVLEKAFFDEGMLSVYEVMSQFSLQQFEDSQMYLCLSSLSRLWIDEACRRLSLAHDRVITISGDFLDLELWKLSHTKSS